MLSSHSHSVLKTYYEGGAVNSSSRFSLTFEGAVSGTIVGEVDSQKVAYDSGPSFGALCDEVPGRLGGEARGRYLGLLYRAIDLQWSLGKVCDLPTTEAADSVYTWHNVPCSWLKPPKRS